MEGLHGLLLEMGLETEAESIEQYAEDVQQRIKKYDEEEQLRLQTLQKSLQNQNVWLSQVEEWSYQQRRSQQLQSRRSSHQTRPSSDTGSERSFTGSPSLANPTFRKQYLSGTTTTTVTAEKPRHLKKTDSFKKRLRESYYLKHQQHRSPFTKDTTPRSLHEVLIVGKDGSDHSSLRDEENPRSLEHDIEGITYVDSPKSSLNTPTGPNSRVSSTYKQSFFGKSQGSSVGEDQRNILETKSSFDMNRIFADGLLFTSLKEEEIASTSSPGNGNLPSHRRTRTNSEDRDNVMELGGGSAARRRSKSSGNSSRLHLFARRRSRERDSEGGYDLEEESRGSRGNDGDEVDEEEDQNLPSGNCVIH